jgi:tetratricopeptide (TPR) repeat protein
MRILLCMTDRLDKLMKLLQLDPTDTFVLYGLAQEYSKQGNHAQAINWYNRTIEVDPHYHYAYFHKARAQQAAGQLAAARQTAAEGLQMAYQAADHKAASELSTLCVELAEG